MVLTSAALLAWGVVVVPLLPPGAVGRAAANLLALTVLLVVFVAGPTRLRAESLGLLHVRRGARWGGGVLAVVAAGYAVVLLVPAGRAALAGTAGASAPLGEVALRVLVLIPLGTVLSEEVAFRGVLLPLAERITTPVDALVVQAVVFALWHLGPALSPLTTGSIGPSGTTVALTLVTTGVGGLAFGWLRQRTGSLLAPIGLHLGTNAAGLVAAALVARIS